MNSDDIRIYNFLKRMKVITFIKFLKTIKKEGIKGVKKKIKARHQTEEEKEQEAIIEQYNYKKGSNIGKLVDYNTPKASIDVVVDQTVDVDRVKEAFKEKNVHLNIIYLVNKKAEKLEKNEVNKKELLKLYYDRAFLIISKKNYDLKDYYFGKHISFDDSFEEEVNELFEKIENFKYFANYNVKDCVTVKCNTFFNYKGSNYYSGGAERYLIDLYEIFKKRGINLDIYQNSEVPFFRKYNGINVIGMSLRGLPLEFDDRYNDRQTKHYIHLTHGKSQLHIYSAFFECFPNCASPSIGISHGIGWDGDTNRNLDAMSFWQSKEAIIESAKRCDTLVSVDTNTANWFQTIDFTIGNKKFSVIPNYVDVKEFVPRPDYTTPRDKIVIVYPRRLYKPRGVYIALEAAEKLVKDHKNVEFHFVGKGFKKETDDIDALCKKYPKRVFRYSKSPFEMHDVYKDADISLIPTIYSEGTSLSCLEAMASGNLVVSTRIGGLSDLIINGYNGYLIEPNADALWETLEHAVTHYEDQMIIKKRGVEVAKAFNKTIWISKWEKEFDKYHLDKKSKNTDLVEFYVKDITKVSDKIKEAIKKELMEKHLVYIRSEVKPKEDTISSGLIQLVDFEDEVVNTASRVYVEKDCKSKVKRNEEIIVL